MERRWAPIVDRYLTRFPSVTASDVDRAEEWASNSSMFYATGSWRAKVVNGTLNVKFIRAHSHWAERASVLRMVMMALAEMRDVPDFEFVYAHNDKDPTPPQWPKCGRRARQRTAGSCRGWPIPLFTNARSASADGTIGAGGLPLPDFTWAGWQKQQPWCQLSAQLQREAEARPWSGRDPRAFFAGGLDNGRDRKELRWLLRADADGGVGARAHELLRVRDVDAGKWHRWAQFDTANRTGSVSAKQAPLPPSAACGHRVALSLAGFGYSSRIRQLLACGALVVHVAREDEEFFMPALEPDRHLVVLRGRNAVGAQLLPTLERLRADERTAARIAAAGQRFARRWLSFASVLAYVRRLLRTYAERFRGAVALTPGIDTRVTSAADLRKLAGLCDCLPKEATAGKRKLTATEEAQQAAARVCMNAVPEAWRCSPWPRKGGDRCHAAKCCVGYDCGDVDLRCGDVADTEPTDDSTMLHG